MKLSEILPPEEVERRIKRTFQLRKLIHALRKENTEVLAELKKRYQNQKDRPHTKRRIKQLLIEVF